MPLELKDPSVFRVFFSSPFNGMEGERELLAKWSWPIIDSECAKKGVRFLPVDMRWGITELQSANHQTINICLGEIDRSDMFVGFFGQRYGWFGAADEALQRSMDAASTRYPWLESFRNRSVTELEFLHGFLNRVGQLPTVVCFRSKAFDDGERRKAEDIDDKKVAAKYTVENCEAEYRMSDLKERIQESEKHCLAVLMDYQQPSDAVQLMHQQILNTWDTFFHTQVKLDDWEMDNVANENYIKRMVLGFNGRVSLLSLLENQTKNEVGKIILLTGEAGCGKSALLAKFITSFKDKPNLFYHMVSSNYNCRKPLVILTRLLKFLKNLIRFYNEMETNQPENINPLKTDVIAEINQLLYFLDKKDISFLIIIDGLEKIIYNDKSTRPMFWLPNNIPKNCCVLLSTNLGDQVNLTEILERNNIIRISVPVLDLEEISLICKELMFLRGKTLSDTHMNSIIKCKNSSNPLFLKVLLEEMSVFGKFRELDRKLNSLLNCETTVELFENFLERIEHDLENRIDILTIVMPLLILCKYGISESTILNNCKSTLNQHQWSVIYYAIEIYSNKTHDGLMKINREELEEAIKKRYLYDPLKVYESHEKLLKILKEDLYTLTTDRGIIKNDRYDEIMHVCAIAKNKQHFNQLLLNFKITKLMIENYHYDLMIYLDEINYSIEEIKNIFTNTLNIQLTNLYIEKEKYYYNSDFTLKNNISNLKLISDFFNAYKPVIEEYFRLYTIEILKNCITKDDDWKNEILSEERYSLACYYVDIKEPLKSIDLHEHCLRYQINKKSNDILNKAKLAKCYHGSAVAYMQLKEFEKSKNYFINSIDIYKNNPEIHSNELCISQSLSCLAQLSAENGDYIKAIEDYEKVVNMESEIYADTLPHESSYSLTNLGICYRKMNRFNEAEAVYNKALRIKIRTLGKFHKDTAYAYINLGNLELDRENLNIAIEYFCKAVEIFELASFNNTLDWAFANENAALVYAQLQEFEKGQIYFTKAFLYLDENNIVDKGLPLVFNNYLQYYFRSSQFDKVYRLSKCLIKYENMRSMLPYLFLHYVIRKQSEYLREKNIVVDQHEGDEIINTSLRIFPQQLHLIYQKIEFDIIPMRNIDELKESLQFILSSDDISIQIADLCEKHSWIDGAITVYKERLQKQDSESCLRNLSCLYASCGKLNEALKSMQMVDEMNNKNDVIIRDKVAYLALLTGNVNLCETIVAEILLKFPLELAIKQKCDMYLDQILKIKTDST